VLSKSELLKQVSNGLRSIATEIETSEPVGKIDWAKLMELFIELLPVILALFQQDKSDTSK